MARLLKLFTVRGLLFLVLIVLFHQKSLFGSIIDFETFPDGTPIPDSTSITTQFPGLLFTNTTVISAGIGLNEFELPPHSGQNVAFDDGGPISISFSTPALSFSGYFTYYEPLTLQAFDASNNQVAAATSAYSINVGCDPGPLCLGDPASKPNEFISLSAAVGISSVRIIGDAGGTSFVMDDVSYTVPETNTFYSTLIVLAVMLLLARDAIHAKTSINHNSL
jgi:hypothetical protein